MLGGPPAGPVIVLALPRGGIQSNDRRYPIAVLAPGYRGLLTSDSTRTPGLVSIVDVAPTALDEEDALGSTAAADPVRSLSELDERIRDNREAKPAVLLVSLALLVALAFLLPAAVLPGFAAILLANLALGIAGATEAWVDAAVIVAFVAASLVFAEAPLVAHGLLLAGTLAAYLVAMGVDERWVALSPLGPTQNARFYGLSNLLATLLLVPALAGAALVGRRFGMWAFAAVAALPRHRRREPVRCGRRRRDRPPRQLRDAGRPVLRLNRRTAVAAGGILAVLAIALVVGGESHVTSALGDGPVGLAEDLWHRLRLSWLRATSGWGVGLLVAGGGGRTRRSGAPRAAAPADGIPPRTRRLAARQRLPQRRDRRGACPIPGAQHRAGVARPADERVSPAVRGPRAQSAPAASP